MYDQLFTQLTSLDGSVGLTLIFLILVLCGLGLPLPEDLPLIAAGYLAYLGEIKLGSAFIAGLLGVLIGDSIIFFVGHKLGSHLFESRFVRAITTPDTIAKVEGWYERQGQKTIFFGRFLTGLRAPIFFVAGATGVSYSKFMLFDGVAAIISVPLWVYAGKFFGNNIDRLFHLVDEFKLGFGIIAGVLIATLIFFILRKAKRAKKKIEMKNVARVERAGPVSQPESQIHL